MSGTIHATAVIDDGARLAAGVSVGPYAVIGADVEIGAGSTVGAAAQVYGPTRIGRDNRIYPQACIGFDPQDLKYEAGQESRLEIGDRNHFRELCTVHRGTGFGGGVTRIGDDNLLMAYTHVAHDCELGNHVIVSNSTQMAGHVLIEDWAIVSGLVAIHQFVRIGAHAFIGGGSRIPQDVPPYCRAVGNPDPKLFGLNSVGLDRRGFSSDVRKALKRTYRLLFQSGLNISQGIARAEAEVEPIPEVRYFLRFIKDSERGITT